MKIFFITDNNQWLKVISDWNDNSNYKISIFCSPQNSKKFSTEIKNKIISPINLKTKSEFLKENFDIGFSCHCKQIFPAELVSNIPCFNFHPGYNPFNRGWFPQVFSIINGMKAGATLHRMDEFVDHGPIIDQKEVQIKASDTSNNVYDQVLKEEFKLFNKWIDKLISGNFNESPLLAEGNYNSITNFKELCEIDLNSTLTFKEAIDFLRAMSFDGYDNAYFFDKDGSKIFVKIELKSE